MRIGIDLMGSDSSPQMLFDAIIQAKEQFSSEITLVIFATKSVHDELLEAIARKKFPDNTARLKFISVTDVIMMGDEPSSAIRHKKNSSIVQGMHLLKKDQLDAFVSAGNTGALVTAASLHLPMLPGIQRPALLALLPSEKGMISVIDVGGNVYSKVPHLIQFAHLGAAFQRYNSDLKLPSVGLLNIGVESKKGTLELRQTYQILQEQTLSLQEKGEPALMHFAGNIEGRDIFHGRVDVVVTDGFTGNVLLKTTEGVSAFILEHLQALSIEMEIDKLEPLLHQFHRHYNYSAYPGALVCGVDAIVIKCHGSSSAFALFNGIKGAIHHVSKNILAQMKAQMSLCQSYGML